MRQGRREFLLQSGSLFVGAALGCSERKAPAATVVTHRPIARVLPGMPTVDGAGVALTRVIGQPALRNLDPFILLDRIHSDVPNAYIAGFPSHPHRGFETVSIMLEGRIVHRDSRGNHGIITGGGAQWMTAGRGIVHSEMPEQERGLLSAFQLWVNLPAKEKMCPQYYQDLAPAAVAEASLSSAGSRARIISGRALSISGPVRTRPTTPTLITLSLEDDTPFELELPVGHTAFAFVHAGSVATGAKDRESDIPGGNLAVFGPGNRLRFRARTERSTVILAAGKPIGEPIVQRGPFVMNTEAEIAQAYADYRAGVLDRV